MIRGLFFVAALLAATTGLTAPASADNVPNSINYQGRLTNNSGQPIADAQHAVIFSFFAAENGPAAALWTSAPVQANTVAGNLTTAITGFPATVFDNPDVWLEVKVDGTPMTPRNKMSAVPFALRSGSVGGAGQWSVTGSDLYFTGGKIGIGTSSPQAILDVRGHLILDAGGAGPAIYTAATGPEANRYVNLINSPDSPSASGLKAGGILVADSYAYANPGKTDLIVKGHVGIGTPTATFPLTINASSYGLVHTDGTHQIGTYINSLGGWLGTRSNDPLHFFSNDSSPKVTLGTNGYLGVANQSPQYELDVNATKGIRLGLGAHGGGALMLLNNLNDNRIYLEGYNAAGNGNASEILVTGYGGANLPQLTLKANVTRVEGDLSCNDEVSTYGPSNTIRTALSYLIANPDNGYIGVGRVGNVFQGYFFVNTSNQSILTANIKNFREYNPKDDNTDIVYACIEGPEAAMYVRGTAKLQNGKAVIELPDHFTSLASPNGLTVQVTALSADSKGLAVTKKSLQGVTVQELMNGTGNYEFDWEAKAVREGYEDYQPVRAWDDAQPGDIDHGKAWTMRQKDIAKTKQRKAAKLQAKS